MKTVKLLIALFYGIATPAACAAVIIHGESAVHAS